MIEEEWDKMGLSELFKLLDDLFQKACKTEDWDDYYILQKYIGSRVAGTDYFQEQIKKLMDAVELQEIVSTLTRHLHDPDTGRPRIVKRIPEPGVTVRM